MSPLFQSKKFLIEKYASSIFTHIPKNQITLSPQDFTPKKLPICLPSFPPNHSREILPKTYPRRTYAHQTSSNFSRRPSARALAITRGAGSTYVCNRSSIAGSVHPVLVVTHTSYSCHDVLEKKSTDSSPSHSQMSRNSSRKSNNSLLVNNGKLEGESCLMPSLEITLGYVFSLSGFLSLVRWSGLIDSAK